MGIDVPIISPFARGARYGYELLARHRGPSTAGDATALPACAHGLALTCRHSASDQPFTLEHRLIGLNAAPEAADVVFSIAAPGPWLVEHVPWTDAEHRITAGNADSGTAVRLGIARKSACLVVEQRIWRAGVTITFVRRVFRAELYHLVARFTPSERNEVNRPNLSNRSRG